MSTSALGSVNGKKLGRKRILDLRPEKFPEEGHEHSLEVRERDVLVNHEALNLMEHGRVADVGVATVNASWRDYPERRLEPGHGADLHGRGVRAQEQSVLQIERCLHVARGMVGREIQRGEIVKVGLGVRAFLDPEAHAFEDADDLFHHDPDRMARTGFHPEPREA